MAIFGLAWFAVAITLTAGQLSGRDLVEPLIIWGLLGVAGVFYLNYIEIEILRTVCVYCLASHILGVTFLASTIVYARTNSRDESEDLKPSS
jgi:uncharacterized membrane protein